jgi:hypothetical protein
MENSSLDILVCHSLKSKLGSSRQPICRSQPVLLEAVPGVQLLSYHEHVVGKCVTISFPLHNFADFVLSNMQRGGIAKTTQSKSSPQPTGLFLLLLGDGENHHFFGCMLVFILAADLSSCQEDGELCSVF